MTSSYIKPPYDEELAQVLAELPLSEPSSPSTHDIIQSVRKTLLSLSTTDEELHREGKIDVEERRVSGKDKVSEISLLICRQKSSTNTASNSLLPCIYYIHGGGMVAGNNRLQIHVLLDWILKFNIIVVSVEYRLAPEHPYPAPVEDCYAGLLWTAAHAQELNIDSSQITILGASAGGGLSAAVVLMARDQKGPRIQGQVLFCPMLDDRMQTFSTYQLEDAAIWDRQANLTGWTALLGDRRGTSDVSPYAAPARAQDLTKLPPTFIDVSSTELFRDEVIDYAQRIWQAGGIAELHVWPGGFHGFAFVKPPTTLAKHALEAVANWYDRLLVSHKKVKSDK